MHTNKAMSLEWEGNSVPEAPSAPETIVCPTFLPKALISFAARNSLPPGLKLEWR